LAKPSHKQAELLQGKNRGTLVTLRQDGSLHVVTVKPAKADSMGYE
jgi:hypothetical protein